MSSAAIVTVYTAGFVRTRPDANRHALEIPSDLGPPAQAARSASAPLRRVEPPAPSDHPQATQSTPASPLPITSPKPPQQLTKLAPAPSQTETNARVVTPVNAATQLSTASSPQSQSEIVASTSPSPVSESPAVASPIATEAPAAPTATNPAPTAPTTPAAPVWKDGKYTAWGTCRHGDIQATVVIEAGKIISAEITDCQTRYSCDIIESLPPKTVSRQKAKFDHVGGATESAYAYFGAVYWALDQASK